MSLSCHARDSGSHIEATSAPKVHREFGTQEAHGWLSHPDLSQA